MSTQKKAITQSAVSQALAELDATESDRASAKKAIDRWSDSGLTATEQNINLYLALKRLKGPDGKVTPNLMKSWVSTAFVRAEWMRTLDVIRKKGKEHILQDPRVKDYLVSPASIRELDQAIDFNEFAVIDPVCREKYPGILEGGVTQVRASVGIEHRSDANPSAEAMLTGRPDTDASSRSDAQIELARVVATNTAENNAVQTQIGQDSAQQQTALERKSSEPDDSQLFKSLEASFIKHANEGRLYNPDKSFKRTAHRCLMIGVNYLQGQKNLSVPANELGPYVNKFFKTTTQKLLDLQCLGDLPHFAKAYQEAEKSYPESMPKIAKALIKLADRSEKVDSAEDLDFACLGLQEQTVHESNLYNNDYLVQRTSARLRNVLSDTKATDANRMAVIRELHGQTPSAEQKATLQVGATILGESSEEVKINFLLDDVGRVALAEEWKPDDTACSLKGVLVPVSGCKGILAADYLRACQVVVKYPGAVDKIPNALIKALVKDYAKMIDCVLEDQERRGFVDQLFLEISAAKLGFHLDAGLPPGFTYGFDKRKEEILRKLLKLASAQYKKVVELSSPVVSKLVRFCSSLDEQAKTLGALPQPLQESADNSDAKSSLPEAAVKPEGTTDKSAANESATTAATAEPQQQMPGQDATDAAAFNEGEKVRLQVKKWKELYDGKLATVWKRMGITAIKYKVKIDEGPEEGKFREFPPEQLKRETSTQQLASPAGVKRSINVVTAEDEGKAQKKAAVAALLDEAEISM